MFETQKKTIIYSLKLKLLKKTNKVKREDFVTNSSKQLKI